MSHLKVTASDCQSFCHFRFYCPSKEDYFNSDGLEKGVRVRLREVKNVEFSREVAGTTASGVRLWEVRAYEKCPLRLLFTGA